MSGVETRTLVSGDSAEEEAMDLEELAPFMDPGDFSAVPEGRKADATAPDVIKPRDMPDMDEILFTYGSVENFTKTGVDPLGHLPPPPEITSDSDDDSGDEDDFDRIATERFMWENFYDAAKSKKIHSESTSKASSVCGENSQRKSSAANEVPSSSLSTREFAVHQAVKFIQSKSKTSSMDEEDPTLFPDVLGSFTKMTNALHQIAQIQARVKLEIQKAKRLTLIREEIARAYPSQEKFNYKAVLTKPYFKDKLGRNKMAITALDSQVTLPYTIPQKHMFSVMELDHLTQCVRRAYFHRKAFVLDSRFTQYFLRVGISEEDIMQLEGLRHQLENELWKMESQTKTTGVGFANKWRKLVNSFIEKDSGFINNLLGSYRRNNINLKPIQIAGVNDLGIQASITVQDLFKYRSQELAALYISRQGGAAKFDAELVDWLIVARDMTEFCERNVTVDECDRVYRICVNPDLNYSAETVAEIKSLKQVVKNGNRDWTDIAAKIKTNRPSVRVFHMYQRLLDNPDSWIASIPNCNEEIALRLVHHGGDMAKVAEELSQVFNLNVSEKKLKLHWKHANPSFARGKFFLEEDGLLLATLELLRDDILEKGFKVINRILPWRHCTLWKNRAMALFSYTTRSWTITEDKILLRLVDQGTHINTITKVLWKKRRTNCERRILMLQRKLQHMTLEEYHLRYSAIGNKPSIISERLSKIQLLLRKLIEDQGDFSSPTEIPLQANETFRSTSSDIDVRTDKTNPIRSSTILTVASDSKTAEERKKDEKQESIRLLTSLYHRQNFVWRPPNEQQCMDYLKTFRKTTLMAAHQRITNFSEGNVDRARNTEHIDGTSPSSLPTSSTTDVAEVAEGCVQKVFDCERRKFIRGDPVSTASALHLRGMSLIVKDNEENLNAWEKLVYSYYRVFENSSRVKFSLKRAYIPTDTELSLMPELQNIIVYPKHLKIFKRDQVVSDVIDDISSAVFYEELKPDTFVSMTDAVARAQKKIEINLTGEKPKRVTKRTKVRNMKKAAAAQRWKTQRERDRLKLNMTDWEEPMEILGPHYEVRDHSVADPRDLLHDHSYSAHCEEQVDMELDESGQD